jgi:hypothetical protein
MKEICKRRERVEKKRVREKNVNLLGRAKTIVSRVQMKSWAGKALETVNCCAFLKR